MWGDACYWMCTLCALDFCGAGLCKCSVCASVSHSVPSPPPTPKKSFRPRGLNRRNIDAYDVLHEKDFFLFSKQVVIVFCCWTFLCFFLFFFYLPPPPALWLSSGSVLALKALTFKCLLYEPRVFKHQTMLACWSHTCDPPVPLLYIVHSYCHFMRDYYFFSIKW